MSPGPTTYVCSSTGSRWPTGLSAGTGARSSDRGSSAATWAVALGTLVSQAAKTAQRNKFMRPRGLGELGGKIIIDATNPLKREGDVLHFSYGVDTSNGQIVQALHPDAFVVKAFNTISWQKMIDPGKPVPVMPLAGNSAEAKAKVAKWAQAMGIETIDIGGIEHARVTEQTVVLMLNNQFSDKPKYEILFRKVD